MIVCRDRDPVAVVQAIYANWNIALTSYLEDLRSWAAEASWGVPDGAFWPLFFDILNNLGLSDKTIGIETGDNINTYLFGR